MKPLSSALLATALAALSPCSPSLASPPLPVFGAATEYSTGNAPKFPKLVDLNNDGKLDLLATNEYSDQIGVWLGNGDGTFSAQTPVADSQHGPYGIACGDLDADGNVDFVVSNWGQNNNGTGTTISIFLGNGNGTFATQTDKTVGTGAISVALADFDADGDLDIVTANQGSGTVTIWRNNGSGGFPGTSESFAAGTRPTYVAVVDFNADGKPDILTVNQETPVGYGSPTHTGSISILINNGYSSTPHFALAHTENVGWKAFAAAIGDLNGDGKPDVVVSNRDDNTVSIMLFVAASGSTWFNRSDLHVVKDPLGIALADVNGDSKLDLVVPSLDSNHVQVLLGSGSGAFDPTCLLLDSGNALSKSCVAIADLNGDARQDLVVTASSNQTVPGKVRVFLANYQCRSDYDGNGSIEPADIAAFTNDWVNALGGNCP